MIEGIGWGVGIAVFGLLTYAGPTAVVWILMRRLAGGESDLLPRTGVLLVPWVVWVALCTIGAHKTFANVMPEMLLLGFWSPLMFATVPRLGMRLSGRKAKALATALATAGAIVLWRFFPMVLE